MKKVIETKHLLGLEHISKSDIETIIESFGKGEMIILIDDEDRENEGDLVVAADHLSPEHINFMIKEGRGLVCAPISKDIAKKISLQLMDGVTNETHTQYTASIDLKSDTLRLKVLLKITYLFASTTLKELEVLLCHVFKRADPICPHPTNNILFIINE